VTLIAGVLTDEYVALISDMRVTRLADGRIISQEDTDTKSIVLGGQFLMGFTGLARIDGLRIEAWISPVLDGVPTENYFEVLRQKIEEAFFREDKAAGRIPHAFLAVGYGSLEPGETLQPLSVTISNSFDAAGTFSPHAHVSMQFRIKIEKLGNRRQLVTCVGYPMHDTARRALAHRIRVVAKGSPGNPALTVWPLLTALRDTARRSDGYVGGTALFASMPRCAVPVRMMLTGPGLDYQTLVASVQLADAASGPADGVVRMPAFISPGGHMIGFRMHPGDLSIEEVQAQWDAEDGYR
jgi:hypothetical protein